MIGHKEYRTDGKTYRRYVCIDCRHEWDASDTYRRWPISISVIPWRHGWAWRTLFSRHGVEIGVLNTGQRSFAVFWRFGLLCLRFGPTPDPSPITFYLSCLQCGTGHDERREKEIWE